MKKGNNATADENSLRIPKTLRVLVGILLMLATVGAVSLQALFG